MSEKVVKKSISGSFFDLGSKELVVRDESLDAAKEDVEKLEIQPKYKKAIITGIIPLSRKLEIPEDKRPERDLLIYSALIKADYNYPTIRSIFLNRHLGCSERIREIGEDLLKDEVSKAFKIYKLRKGSESTFQRKVIAYIKKAQDLKAEERLKLISEFILGDLLLNESSVGCGYLNRDRQIYYFFDKTEKMLMDLEGNDFYCFVRDRFGIPQKDFQEARDTIMTEIWKSKNHIEAHQFAYFDSKSFVLYISDHANGIYKLDGEGIVHVDNGTDGIFFQFNSDFTPFNLDLNEKKAINYFERGPISNFTKALLDTDEDKNLLGFCWSKFKEQDCLLRKYLIDRTNFAYESNKDLTVDEQKQLLLIYFYSLFFESIQSEKPIICFVGRKESGKSFIATSIGQILFGDKFQSRHCPDNLNDLRTIIGENYYMVFDNLDHYVKSEIIDTLCVAATGGTVEKRKLYTDYEIVKIRPHIFLVITTREAKFKRDDLVSRLLLFNMQKINRPKSKSILFKSIAENRNKIIAEILINLNSIINLLKCQQNYVPDCISRIADWETFGRKVAGFPGGAVFRTIMEKMNEEKDKFGLEDDYLYIILKSLVIEKEQDIDNKSTSELYAMLVEEAESLKIKDFTKRYKSPISIGKRLANIKDELSRDFLFISDLAPSNLRYYTIVKKFGEDDELEPGWRG